MIFSSHIHPRFSTWILHSVASRIRKLPYSNRDAIRMPPCRRFANPAFLRTSKIMTLIPERMSAMGQEVYSISSDDAITFDAAPDGKPQIRYHEEDREELDYYRRFPFPSGTRGVFYYHQPPDRPPVAGELRFRVCDSVSHFVDGADQKSQRGHLGGRRCTGSSSQISGKAC